MSNLPKKPWKLSTHASTFEQTELATIYGVKTIPTEDGLGQAYVHIVADGFDHTNMEEYHEMKTELAEFIVMSANYHDRLVAFVRRAMYFSDELPDALTDEGERILEGIAT